MSWIVPVATRTAKYAVKYGPQAKIAWDNGGKHVQGAVQDKLAAVTAQRAAFQKAETVVAGTVLEQRHEGKPVWVVFSGDEPVEAFPRPSIDLMELLKHANLSQRATPEDYRERQLRQRARGVRKHLPSRKRHDDAASPEPESN